MQILLYREFERISNKQKNDQRHGFHCHKRIFFLFICNSLQLRIAHLICFDGYHSHFSLSQRESFTSGETSRIGVFDEFRRFWEREAAMEIAWRTTRFKKFSRKKSVKWKARKIVRLFARTRAYIATEFYGKSLFKGVYLRMVWKKVFRNKRHC